MNPPGTEPLKVLIRGAGDCATGVALSLHHAGFAIVMTEQAEPAVIRRTVSFAEAVFQGSQTVEGAVAELSKGEDIAGALAQGRIAVVVDPLSEIRKSFAPDVVVDAILAKKNLGTTKTFAPVVIGLGPGFTAGKDVHAVIETMRGHELGRILYEGSAQPDTGMPGEIQGRTSERVLKAPGEGRVVLLKRIGDLVRKGETVMTVGGAPVTAPLDGCVRGLIHEGLYVSPGLKIGDIDPRGKDSYTATISDKARTLGRAALEAVLVLGRDKGLFSVERTATPSRQ
ncbi:MAG TPA: selenium-dependent molybdenum cofactor biosynthesis protein YqeB [Spirochaetia bacterium]|nr:selenium-dependent molybdenum cofactor biosynthesis protein YqeB [Spirochaetia bacterium]